MLMNSEEETRLTRALLIGGTGFVGGHLQRHLLGAGLEVGVHGDSVDVRNAGEMQRLISAERPDAVIHLAAVSSVPESLKNPRETYEINFFGTLNVLLALKASNFRGRLLYIGSGDVYGLLGDRDLPVTEDRPLKPKNPYAVSKVAAEALCYQWSHSAEFQIIMARPFNHIGPGQSERFALSDFARQIVEIKLGRRPAVLRVGDIDVTRDFTDVRDVVRAYGLLLEKGKNGEAYNVCSGREQSIRSLLLRLMSIAGIDAEIEQDRDRFRPSEQRRVFGSFEKLGRDTGWMPAIPLEQTLRDILDDWRMKLI
ncbi:MAG TPA: GDP-mannose 4,6-dehydratase [Nitrospirota bacterium]